jgi:hypothetical protein
MNETILLIGILFELVIVIFVLLAIAEQLRQLRQALERNRSDNE